MKDENVNAWGSASKVASEVKETLKVIPTNAPNTPLYLVIVLLICVFVLLGLVFFLYFNQNTKTTTNPVTAVNKSSVSVTEDTVVSEDLSTSSSNSSRAPYYKYSTNTGKYVTFDYPVGGRILIESMRDDKTFTKATDIGSIEITFDNIVVGTDSSGGIDECQEVTYDISKPNQLSYRGPEYSGTDKLQNVKTETWDLSGDKNVIVNKTRGYALISSSKIPSEYGPFLMLDKFSDHGGEVAADGIYHNYCNSKKLEPSGFLVSANGNYPYSAYCHSLSGKSDTITEANKCVEVLDRFITSFKVK